MNTIKKGNITVSLFRIAIPVIFQGLILQMQVLVDRAFLGQLNSEYFSAIRVSTAWPQTVGQSQSHRGNPALYRQLRA